MFNHSKKKKLLTNKTKTHQEREKKVIETQKENTSNDFCKKNFIVNIILSSKLNKTQKKNFKNDDIIFYRFIMG